jgi:hypothetical protein
MPIQFSHRLSFATAAVAAAWAISGAVFIFAVRGPGSIEAWLIWGTGLFTAGWILVALPLVALGDRILRLGTVWLALLAGAGGTLVIELPYLITRVLSPRFHYIWSVRDLTWPGFSLSCRRLRRLRISQIAQ